MQPWLIRWGSGKENDTLQSIMQLLFQPPLTPCPLLPQPQAQGCWGSPVSHNLRNSWQEQFSGEAVAPRREQRGCFSVYTWGLVYDPSLIYISILFLCKTGTSEVDQQGKIYSDFYFSSLFSPTQPESSRGWYPPIPGERALQEEPWFFSSLSHELVMAKAENKPRFLLAPFVLGQTLRAKDTSCFLLHCRL